MDDLDNYLKVAVDLSSKAADVSYVIHYFLCIVFAN